MSSDTKKWLSDFMWRSFFMKEVLLVTTFFSLDTWTKTNLIYILPIMFLLLEDGASWSNDIVITAFQSAKTSSAFPMSIYLQQMARYCFYILPCYLWILWLLLFFLKYTTRHKLTLNFCLKLFVFMETVLIL